MYKQNDSCYSVGCACAGLVVQPALLMGYIFVYMLHMLYSNVTALDVYSPRREMRKQEAT